MPNNHIIIGLGGTGGRVIRAFRTLLWQEHRNKEPRDWNEKEGKWSEPLANIGYLYVDSSNQDLNESDGLWQSLGESLALEPANKLLIRDSDMEEALDNLQQNPGIRGWIGDREVLKKMLQNCRGVPGANQIRRFGRFMFAAKAKEFNSRIQELVNKLIVGGNADVTFHVCCTLGCGTGSGSILDVISQLRKLYPAPSTHRMFLYTLITDQHVPQNVGFFYPNQYAALLELNALRTGNWKIHDVASFNEERLDGLRDNFQSCYVVTSINEKGEVATREEQEQMIANYIYQKTVALRGITPKHLLQAETFEDLVANSLSSDRASCFGSFGIKRFAIPEEEIREKLSYTFALQAVRQGLFNNWSDGNGFLRAALNRDLPELVTNPENNERWFLTDEHLKISRDFVLTGSKTWPTIRDEWDKRLKRKMGNLIETKNSARKDREVWLTEMLDFGSQFYAKLFRDRGVTTFYDDKREAILDYAREIKKKVEMDLFERWRLGQDSITDSLRIVDALIKQMEHRKDKFDQQIADARSAEKKAGEDIKKAEITWQKIGFLTEWLTSKPVQVLGTYVNALIEKYVADTEVIACAFAKQLTQLVINQLTESRNGLSTVSALLGKLEEDYAKQVAMRIAKEEVIDFRKRDVRLVAPVDVNRTIKVLETDRKAQEAQCKSARDRISEVLGVAAEEQTFSSFAKKIDEETLKRTMFKSCDEAGVRQHDHLFASESEYRKVLGVNIVEKLNEKFGGVTEQLKGDLRTLVQSAAAYMRFNPQQTQPSVIYKQLIPEMPKRAITVFLPKCEHLEQSFRRELKSAFEMAHDQGLVTVEDSDHNPYEITIISVSFWFELRFLLPLVSLRERYESLIRSAEREKIHQIHLENHRAPITGQPVPLGFRELPSLYTLTDSEVAREAFKHVLLANAMGFIKPEENPNGTSTLHFCERNDKGRAMSDLVDLGSTELYDAAKNISPEAYAAIKSLVERKLRDAYQHVDRRRSLKDKLEAGLDAKFEECGSKNKDPIFLAFKQGTEQAHQLLAAN